jgi:hypothetical protein
LSRFYAEYVRPRNREARKCQKDAVTPPSNKYIYFGVYIATDQIAIRHKSSVKSRAQSLPVPISSLVSIKGIRLLRIVTSIADPAAPQARTGIASGMERAYPSVRIIAFLLNPAFEARRT